MERDENREVSRELFEGLDTLMAEYEAVRQDIYNQYSLLAEAVFDGEIIEKDDLTRIMYEMSDFYADSRFLRLGDRLASYIHRIYPEITAAMGYLARPLAHPDVDIAEILMETWERCEAAFQGKVADIILYGPYASGMPDAESDINIMVLLDINEQAFPQTRYPVCRISSELSLKHDITVSVTARPIRHWNENKDTDPFYSRILCEGRQYSEVVSERIAQEAEFIVNGYAFLCKDGKVSVWNLHDITRSSVLNKDGEVLETSMDEIEVSIVQTYWERNKQFVEDGTTGRRREK